MPSNRDDPIAAVNEAVKDALGTVYDVMTLQRAQAQTPLGGEKMTPSEIDEENRRYLSEESLRRSLFDQIAARYNVSKNPNPKTGKVAPIPRRWVEREKLAARTLRKEAKSE